MKKEEKELLLKDLCGRLPYGVKCKVSYNSGVINDADATLYGIDKDGFLMFDEIGGDHREFLCKPYLFPVSNITEEQKKDLLLTVVGKEGLKLFSVTKDGIVSNDKSEQSLYNFSFNNVEFSNETTEAYIDWLNKNHFDYRGLIEKSLALDASGLNIY